MQGLEDIVQKKFFVRESIVSVKMQFSDIEQESKEIKNLAFFLTLFYLL